MNTITIIAKYKVARDCFDYAFKSITKTTTKEVKKLGAILSTNPGDTPTNMQDPQWDAAYSYCNNENNGKWEAPLQRLSPALLQSIRTFSKFELQQVRALVVNLVVNAVVLLQKISG